MDTSISYAEDADCCYICLEGSESGPLRACSSKCFAKAHPLCLARWQLEQAGKEEEQFCRFCQQHLPNWKEAYSAVVPSTHISMVIMFNGKATRIHVRPGPEGEKEFKRVLRELHGDSTLSDSDLEVSFHFKSPSSEREHMTLLGMSAFDAAVYCAALSRKQRRMREKSSSRYAVAGSQAGGRSAMQQRAAGASSNSGPVGSQAAESNPAAGVSGGPSERASASAASPGPSQPSRASTFLANDAPASTHMASTILPSTSRLGFIKSWVQNLVRWKAD